MINSPLQQAIQAFRNAYPAASEQDLVSKLTATGFSPEEIGAAVASLNAAGGPVTDYPGLGTLPPSAGSSAADPSYYPSDRGSSPGGVEAAVPDIDEPFDLPSDVKDELGGKG